MPLQFFKIGSIMQVTKSFRCPMMLVRMRIDDNYIAIGAYYAAKFSQDSARTDHMMKEHMAHHDIDGTRCKGKLFGHPLSKRDMLISCLSHLLPSACEHGRCAIHPDHFSHKWSHHACKVSCACSHVEYRHVLMPGEEPCEPLLKFDLVGTRDIGVPGRCDLLKIVPFVHFNTSQLLLRRGRQIEPNQGIEMLKNFFVGGKQILEPPSLVLLLEELARPP